MNENLDLTKVLRNAPEGMKLWSPLYGDCIFMNIDLVDVIYPINCKVTTKDGRSTYVGFTIDGMIDIQFENCGCVLFPSKENMDWSTFKVPKTHKEFELNQKVLVGLPFNNQHIWRRDIYLNYDEYTKTHCTFYENEVPDSLIIPYDKDKDGKQVSSDLQDKKKCKSVNNNGFGYVDLGLPSGTKWATMNVGASKPSDAGLYFQWGDTQGYTADQVGTGEGKKKFASNESDYKFGVYPNYTKYTTLGVTLDLEDDAAHANMGGSWHMPTPDQIQELLSNTTNTWTTRDGKPGRLFTSKKDESKSIFIPAAGYARYGLVQRDGDYGYVWSSMLNTVNVDYGQYLVFSSGGANLSYGYDRYGGFSVRGVIG